MTGKEMRAELSYCGWPKRKAAFFRVIQTLKQANLIDATRIPREEDEYRGAQCLYQLTREGRDAAAVMRALYTKAEKRQRLRRWRGKRKLGLSRRFKQSAEHAALAKRRNVSRCDARVYDIVASLGAPFGCPNGVDSELRPHDSRFWVDDRKSEIDDSESQIGDSKFHSLKFKISNRRPETSRRRFEVSNRQARISNRRFEVLDSQFEVSIYEIRSFKTATRNFKETVSSFESIAPNVQSPLWSARITRPRRLRSSRAREPPV